MSRITVGERFTELPQELKDVIATKMITGENRNINNLMSVMDFKFKQLGKAFKNIDILKNIIDFCYEQEWRYESKLSKIVWRTNDETVDGMQGVIKLKIWSESDREIKHIHLIRFKPKTLKVFAHSYLHRINYRKMNQFGDRWTYKQVGELDFIYNIALLISAYRKFPEILTIAMCMDVLKDFYYPEDTETFRKMLQAAKPKSHSSASAKASKPKEPEEITKGRRIIEDDRKRLRERETMLTEGMLGHKAATRKFLRKKSSAKTSP